MTDDLRSLGEKINSYPSRRLVRALELDGYSRAEIARRLGLRSGRFRLHNRITRRNALKIQALWRQVSGG